MSDPIIKVINVTKRFGEEEALHCVNFDFERGDSTADNRT